MDLFIQPAVELEKTAGEVELPEDPNAWPQEVLQELFKQVPYISDFQPHVQMDKVDAEQGYGLGHVEIANQSEAQMNAEPEAIEAAGIRSVRIPVIIKDGKLNTFDLLLTDGSKVLPLTEARLRQSLFRPQAFDVTSKTPGDQSMIGQLYPPYRQNYGFGRSGTGTVMGTGLGKMGSALESYLTDDGQEKTAITAPKITGVIEGALEKGVSGERLAKHVRKLRGFRERAFQKVEEGKGGVPALKRAIEVSYGIRGAVPALGKKASILEGILPTLNKTDFDQFWEKVSSDHSLQARFRHNADATQGALGLLAGHEPTEQEKTADAALAHIKPSVVQITKLQDGYMVKTASHLYWKPTESRVGRGDVVQSFGEKVALAADESGAVTLAEGADAEDAESPLDAEEPISISEAGLYKVYDEEGGKELVGFVVPNLLDVDGTPMPLSLFTNGSQATVQADIIGEPAGAGVNLPTGQPGGAGAFFDVTDEGQVQATIPLNLGGGSYATEDGMTVLSGETFDGRPLEVSIQQGIQTVMGTPEGRMLVPEHWQWTPMGDAAQVSLAGGEDEQAEAGDDAQLAGAFGQPEVGATPDAGTGGEEAAEAAAPAPAEGKQASAQYVYARGGPDTYSISGPAVDKLASDERAFINLDGAMFLLAGLGVSQGYGVQKLAHACSGMDAEPIRIGRLIKTAAEMDAWAAERAQALLSVVPVLKKDLVKEAALIPDPTAVDTVLSLGFINPENIMSFVGYLPDIDDAQGKLCELLLASRLGLSDVPASALERAVRSVEEVIEGLKILAFQGA